MIGPIPSWYGDTNEFVDAKWWDDYLAQGTDETPLRGPSPIRRHDLIKGIYNASSNLPTFIHLLIEVPLTFVSDEEVDMDEVFGEDAPSLTPSEAEAQLALSAVEQSLLSC